MTLKPTKIKICDFYRITWTQIKEVCDGKYSTTVQAVETEVSEHIYQATNNLTDKEFFYES